MALPQRHGRVRCGWAALCAALLLAGAACGGETEQCQPDDSADCSCPPCADVAQDVVGCGDGVCAAPGETAESCYADCGSCGDAACTDGEETASRCYEDCGSCGDAACTDGEETATSCYKDCGRCGDAVCTEAHETATSCYDDCGGCGDAVCTDGEEIATSCYQDCGRCGDTLCTAAHETLASCYDDCGGCGDTLCTAGEETAASCYQDCGSCGDALCTEAHETATSCYEDCGSCGDTLCTASHETIAGCYADCGTCGDTLCTEPHETSASCGQDCDAADTIYGVDVPRANSWWVDAGQLHYGDAVETLHGINWFGLETEDRALHGLWSDRTLDDFLLQLVSLGFDTVRVPLSPESINPGFASASWATVAAVDTGREQLEALIEAAGVHGLRLLLDVHTCASNVGGGTAAAPDACDGYTNDNWLADLTTLAGLTVGHPHIVGIDLFNEPYGLTWPQWVALVELGAQAVLTVNPRILVIAEGVGNASPTGNSWVFWGENLHGAATLKPNIPMSRLVWSPHVYGPGVSWQEYFSDASFPANMPAVWEAHFGQLLPGPTPLAIGEFGGHYDDAVAAGEVAWNDAFVAWLVGKGITSFFYWSFNPNSPDTGGLLMDDWLTPVPAKLQLLAPLLSGP